MRAEKLVSTRALREGLRELEEGLKQGARFLPGYMRERDEMLLLEFQRLVREAEIEYVSTGAATELTGWDGATLRKYAKRALEAGPMPEEWSRLVVRREGKEYAFVLSTIPAKGVRSAA